MRTNPRRGFLFPRRRLAGALGIDPKEKLVAVALAQHFPFNEHNFFAQFQTGYYQALR